LGRRGGPYFALVALTAFGSRSPNTDLGYPASLVLVYEGDERAKDPEERCRCSVADAHFSLQQAGDSPLVMRPGNTPDSLAKAVRNRLHRR
jgi:hypothetical protein